MEIVFEPAAQEDLKAWVKAGDKTILKKIAKLIEAIVENPYQGIGKPEQLKFNLSGVWSRRINREHRLIYEVLSEKVIIHSLQGHYK